MVVVTLDMGSIKEISVLIAQNKFKPFKATSINETKCINIVSNIFFFFFVNKISWTGVKALVNNNYNQTQFVYLNANNKQYFKE